jgi:Flp pilus assembly protein CpaB
MELAQRMLSTRRGTLGAGAAAAVLAAFILLLYLNQYRSSVTESSAPMTVLVAKQLIEKGTPGDVIGIKELFQTTEASRSELKDGAITDPAALRGRLAVREIYPGQQLTISDFSASRSDSLGATITNKQRAIAVPLDAAHGIVGQIKAGDRVDVFAGFNVIVRGSAGFSASTPVVKVLMQNALVLDPGDSSGSGLTGTKESNIVLRTTRDEAAQIAWAVDNGKVWVVLRPRTGASVEKPGVVTAESVLLGIKPVVVFGNARKALRRAS